MKKFAYLLVVILLFTACNKDSITSLLPQMSASIDGDAWKSSLPIAVDKEGHFVITGTELSGETIIITINGNTAGVYNFTDLKCSAVYKKTADQSTEDAYISVSGKVNLSEVNAKTKTISGTFNFKVLKDITSNIEITNGVFSNVNYTVE